MCFSCDYGHFGVSLPPVIPKNNILLGIIFIFQSALHDKLQRRLFFQEFIVSRHICGPPLMRLHILLLVKWEKEMHWVIFIYKALLLKLPLYLNPVIMGLPYHKGLLITARGSLKYSMHKLKCWQLHIMNVRNFWSTSVILEQFYSNSIFCDSWDWLVLYCTVCPCVFLTFLRHCRDFIYFFLLLFKDVCLNGQPRE